MIQHYNKGTRKEIASKLSIRETTQTTQTTQLNLDGTVNNYIEPLTDKDLEILNILKILPKASQSLIATELDWGINTVKYYTKKLKKAGLLSRNGSSRTGKWIVKQ